MSGCGPRLQGRKVNDFSFLENHVGPAASADELDRRGRAAPVSKAQLPPSGALLISLASGETFSLSVPWQIPQDSDSLAF